MQLKCTGMFLRKTARGQTKWMNMVSDISALQALWAWYIKCVKCNLAHYDTKWCFIGSNMNKIQYNNKSEYTVYETESQSMTLSVRSGRVKKRIAFMDQGT